MSQQYEELHLFTTQSSLLYGLNCHFL